MEFAPGLGYTASMALQNQPKSYTGIEFNEAAALGLRKIIFGEGQQIIVGDAANSTLEDDSADKVYGEAMLTMQADHRKAGIVGEVYGILRAGDRYRIHELCLCPDDLDEAIKATIQRELAQVIKVNSRPLTLREWTGILEKEDFRVVRAETNPMRLLKPLRVPVDEGLLQTVRIASNVITHLRERQRIFAMREIFKKYQQHLNAVAIVSEKR